VARNRTPKKSIFYLEDGGDRLSRKEGNSFPDYMASQGVYENIKMAGRNRIKSNLRYLCGD
jgi:hypothetical protein